jgi:transcriptional regulator with XRE-family HTH domain
MDPVLNLQKIKALMASKHLTVTRLSHMTGLSRQSLHKFLKPEYQPFSSGFRAFADALGADPRQLLQKTTELDLDIQNLLALSAGGEPRAFELLPASAANAHLTPDVLVGRSPTELQLLTAAIEVALSIQLQPHLETLLDYLVEQLVPEQAFFFGGGLIPPERSVAVTPPEMKKHRVFGAFGLADFQRHFS